MNSHCKNETTLPDYTFVGTDVSKLHLDSFIPGASPRRDPNLAEGYQNIIANLRLIPRPWVVCEATGGYERGLVNALMDEDIPVSILYPKRARSFSDAAGRLAKTDGIDAEMLSKFGDRMRPRRAIPTDPESIRLRQILDARQSMVKNITTLTNQLELAEGYLREALEADLAHFTKHLAEVEIALTEHLKNSPELKQKSDRLQQVKGVGPVLANTLLAYVPELGKVDDKALSSLIGVAPHPQESGSSRGKRQIKGGRGQVRKVLYMAAVSAVRSNPILRTFYLRLKTENHKKPKVALVAVMRKLLRLLNMMISKPTFTLA